MNRYHLNNMSISSCDGGRRNHARIMIRDIDIKSDASKASSIGWAELIHDVRGWVLIFLRLLIVECRQIKSRLVFQTLSDFDN